MRLVRVTFALFAPLFLAGCGYVHFGRLPTAPAAGGDGALATAYSNLSTEHKILKQELALARKEGDTLRIALERTAAGAGNITGTASADLLSRLTESSRELATLRASYAKLQTERSGPVSTGDSRALVAAKADLEEKLATTLRLHTQLQEDNGRLRTELERTRAENLGLNEQLKSAELQAARAQNTLAQLNTDLINQKEARTRAEQSAEAVRAQLQTVLAHAGGAPAEAARATTATAVTSLQIAKAPPADSSPTAELRMNTDRLRAATASTNPAAQPGRVHVVQAGDTLEKLARHYYGGPDRWRTIYDANTTLLSSGQPLRVGMQLQIPAN